MIANTVYVLTMVFFLQGGVVGSHSITAPSMEDCQAAIPDLQKQLIGTQVPVGDENLLVLDAQGVCNVFTKADNASLTK